MYNEPPKYGKGLRLTSHDAAQVMLEYLVQLPDSVIPWGAYTRFQAPLRYLYAKTPNYNEPCFSEVDFDLQGAVSFWKEEISRLPSPNHDVLLFLLCWLPRTVQMAIPMLAARFQPCLLAPRSLWSSPKDVMVSRAVLVCLFENRASFVTDLEM